MNNYTPLSGSANINDLDEYNAYHQNRTEAQEIQEYLKANTYTIGNNT